jgi:hypothetical protein
LVFFAWEWNLLKIDTQLRSEILSLLAPSYEDPTALLEREVAACDTLYTDRDPDGKLKCFFMVGWQDLSIGGAHQNLAYLGLSGASVDVKNTARVRGLYDKFNSEAVQWERDQGQTLVLWFTTASPSAYYAGANVFDKAEPFLDGTYSKWGLQVVCAIRERQGYGNSCHPFVAKSVALATRYSLPELERIQRICSKSNFQLFEQLAVDERGGDRLLVVCRPRI